MPKFTNEDKDLIKEKLKYIGIDLEHIPNIIRNTIPIELTENIEEENRVYKYVDIDKIQIWITPKNRNVTLKEKIEKAVPFYELIEPIMDDQMEKYSEFIRMLNLSSKEEIDEIEKSQELYLENIPFEIRYNKSFFWQIYYSETNDLFYMIVPNDNPEYNEMFYIIKKQIEFAQNGKVAKVYVPISNLKFESNIIKKQDIQNLEKYLWLFTKEYPIIYEVYNKENKPNIQVIGETYCFEKIKTKYKKILNNVEEANEFYKLVKALFILQTEMNHYKFATKISENGEIQFSYNQRIIAYENLPEFIRQEYVSFCNLLNSEQEDKRELRNNLNDLKKLSNYLEKQYLLKQKEIATYLQYKKSFLGKIRFFLRPKINIQEIDEIKNNETQNTDEKEIMPILKIKTEKINYTLEDLIELFNLYKKETNTINNLKLDIGALESKNKILKKKNENAVLYIKEINEHKKSIFEFWKFTNKDEKLVLEAGAEINNEEHKLKKTFDYESDFDELGIKLDKMQRKNLSKEEQDSIFLADSSILKIINLLRNDDRETIIEDAESLKLRILKEKQKREKDFDIFGTVIEDKDKVKDLANSKHRETEKNEIQIININENSSTEELIRKHKAKRKEY